MAGNEEQSLNDRSINIWLCSTHSQGYIRVNTDWRSIQNPILQITCQLIVSIYSTSNILNRCAAAILLRYITYFINKILYYNTWLTDSFLWWVKGGRLQKWMLKEGSLKEWILKKGNLQEWTLKKGRPKALWVTPRAADNCHCQCEPSPWTAAKWHHHEGHPITSSWAPTLEFHTNTKCRKDSFLYSSSAPKVSCFFLIPCHHQLCLLC